MSRPLEHDYIGLAERASMAVSERSSSLNLKETELRLGLPGCQSPERKSGGGVSLFGRDLQNNKGSLKRGFSDAIDDGKWVFCSEGENDNTHKISRFNRAIQNKNTEVSATKAQVVGWPPIRSFRRNTMACNVTKNSEEEEEEEEEAGSCGCLYVKVSMDGAPYLRKVDLRTYTNYLQLSSALENMFSCFTIGQCSSGKDGPMSERRLRDLVDGCEYVLTYEDKDGDWMLVGDVPWEMFIESCRRLRIMKGSEAIGLAPRAMEKSRSQK